MVSLLLHSGLILGLGSRPPEPERPDFFTLPDTIEFGLTEAALGPEGAGATAAAAKPAAEPPPEPKAPPKVRAPKHVPKPAAAAAAVAVSNESTRSNEEEEAAPAESAAAVSGLFGAGAGSGSGLNGDGPGGVGGGTIALNVDLERVRNSALLLETRALLDIIPEWQALLAGSGIEPVRDFRRVFVAAPSLDRAALVVSAEHALSPARITSAVGALAAERGSPSPRFRNEDGVAVAAWHNRGPTERVIALTSDEQLLITRGRDLGRVLSVSRALGIARKSQGFAAEELEARGGLLAMQPDEAVALWVEGLRRYVRNGPDGIPDSVRLSIFKVDQFHTDLAIAGNYASASEATDALAVMDALRVELSDHPRVVFLGLKSAVDRAQIEQQGKTLRLKVRLTLHQTRYLMSFVRMLLRPRAS